MDLSALSNVTTSAQALSNLILVSPQNTIGYQPQNPASKSGTTQQQPPALLFHTEGENTVSLESDVTDHYVENNTTIQDHVALKPELITVSGYIGELNDVSPKALAALKTLADKLTTVSAYTPSLSLTALLAYNTAFQLYQTGANVVNSAVSTWSSITGNGGEGVISSTGIVGTPFNQTKQQVAFQQFYGYWRSRTLFTVQTPWAVFQNMVIKNLRAIQGEETNVITNFEITFKMIRFASSVVAANESLGLFDNTQFQNRLSAQGADSVSVGTSTPVDVSSTLPQSSAISGVVG